MRVKQLTQFEYEYGEQGFADGVDMHDADIALQRGTTLSFRYTIGRGVVYDSSTSEPLWKSEGI